MNGLATKPFQAATHENTSMKATVKISKNSGSANSGKIVSGIPITTKGLAAQYKVNFKDPANQSVTLSVNGPSERVDAVTIGDFTAYVDLSSLTEGDHDVKIQVEGPSDINWNIDKSMAKITISKASV